MCSVSTNSRDLHVVAREREQLGAHGVRHVRGEPLLQRSVPEKRQQVARDLPQKLVLAAWNREDRGGLPAHRPRERGVRRRVAGVQADDEVGALESGVTGDVAHLEPQPLGPELPRRRLAPRDDVLLEVEPDDLDVPSVHDAEEVMESEGQVRLAGAEVDTRRRPSGSAGRTSPTSSRKRLTWRNLP